MTSVTLVPTHDRLTALAGAGFSACLFAGVFVLNVPREATDPEVVEFWSTSGNRAAAVASMLLLVLAAVAFLVFAGRLNSRLRAGGAPAALVDTGFALAAACSASLAVAAAIRGTLARALESGEPLPGVDVLRYVPELASTVLGTAAMALAAAYVVATALAARSAGVASTRMTVFSGVVAVLVALAAAVGAGPIAIPVLIIWVAVTSTGCWRGRQTTSSVVIATVDHVHAAAP